MAGISLMRFFKQDRITTTSSTNSTTTKPITTIRTIVMVVAADGDFVVTVVVVMAAVADGDVLAEHIDPDEPTNIMVPSAFEWIQA